MDSMYLCRLCLCRSESFIDVFGENIGLGFNVETAIRDLLQFDVVKVEGVPSLACYKCIKDLNHFRIFKSRCLDSKITFEKRLRLRERSPRARESGAASASEAYEGNLARGGKRLERSSVTSEGICRRRLNSEEGSDVVSASGEVRVKQEDNVCEEEVSIPLDIVKIEHDIGPASRDEQGLYGEESAAVGDLGQSSSHEEWGLNDNAEDYSAPEGGSEVSFPEETSGIGGSGIVLLKTESIAEMSTHDTEEFVEMSSMDGSVNADPLPDKYTREELKCALDEVKAGGAIRVVGRAYGIPESTIRGHLAQERLTKQDVKKTLALNSKRKRQSGSHRGTKDSESREDRKKLRSPDKARSKPVNHVIGSSPPSDGLERFGHFLERLLSGESQKKPSQVKSEKVSSRKTLYEGESSKRKHQYTENQMMQAINAALAGRPIRQVGREMGIAESTIRLRMKRMREDDS
ncbi:uncharacterized protein LOC124163445 [Ischnura elegans]|uniref:uncharacterized protein LOC124163445 n=1 Tax=Ischnura elegans TaxID=197161 RepID=UPI001ED8BE0D|nr:uncharacterized protein LOC124163445 [Ischnura elegans]